MCNKCNDTRHLESEEIIINNLDIETKDGDGGIGPYPKPSGIFLGFDVVKRSGTVNTYDYTMKFWHYRRDVSSWETFNLYGQNLILYANGSEIKRHTFKFGNGHPTYYHPNNILRISGSITITGNTTLTYKTTCTLCENGSHNVDYERFNFTWGSRLLSYTNPQVIPGVPNSSIRFNRADRISYNGYNTYPSLNNDMTTYNSFNISMSVGANGNKLKCELQYSSDGNTWTTYNVSSFNTIINTTSTTLSYGMNQNDRGRYFRWRVGNGSSTNDWTYAGWQYFRVNSLPNISGRVVAPVIENETNSRFKNIIYNGITLNLPTVSDLEEPTSNCRVRLYLRTRTSGGWSGWSYIGEYNSGATSIRIIAENHVSPGGYIQFGVIGRDSLEYNNGNFTGLSMEYMRNNKPPEKPIIMTPQNGERYLNSVIPIISGDNIDYKKYPEIFTIEYRVDNGSFLPTDRLSVGDSSNSFFYNGRSSITGYSQHTVQARATNNVSGTSIMGDIVTFTIYMSNKPVPVILNVEEGRTYSEAKPELKPDSRIGSHRAYLNGNTYKMGTTITQPGNYNVKVIAISNDTNEEGEAQVNFRVDNSLPEPIEIYGVVENDVKTSYSIHVIKQSSAGMVVDLNGEIINTNNSTYNGRSSYNFNVSNLGVYKLIVTAVSNSSGKTRTAIINRFTVQRDSLNSGNLIRFKEVNGPVHSAQTILNSGTPQLNLVEYNIDGLQKRYSSPILIFDNKNVKGTDRNRANDTYVENTSYNGFINYKPEVPTINGTGDGRIHEGPVNITFRNNASRPNQAKYKITIDGKEISNPFNNTFTVDSDGYHYITILGWDSINPKEYQYYSMRFLVKSHNVKNIRNPYIIAYKNEKDTFVDVKVKFASTETNFKHSIKITEKDGTSKITEYPYNIKTVSLNIRNNCTIEATTKIVNSNLVRTVSKKIDTIFDTIPLSNIKLFGVNKYTFNNVTYKIGKKCYLEIERRYNEEYEVYINGMPYKIGDVIENRIEEIKKYTVEVVIRNKVKNLETYYSDTFFIDSINPAPPVLMNMTNNLMDRKFSPKKLELKDESNTSSEGVILNNRVINIQTNIISKDDEYILTVTYLYYNGAKRTNSFYFSVNTNPIDELKPNRCILKLLDYNNGDIAKEGELLIDRHTGHIYYKDGTIKPITRNIEEEILKLEKQLIKVESNHETIQSIQFLLDEMIIYTKNKQSEFLSKIRNFKNKLDSITKNIDDTIKKINNLENELNSIDEFIQSIVNEINGNRANQIKNLTSNVRTLNNNFINLSNSLKDVFHRASICTQKTFELRDEISTRVTVDEFNSFKQNEINKYNQFIQTLRNMGVNV